MQRCLEREEKRRQKLADAMALGAPAVLIAEMTDGGLEAEDCRTVEDMPVRRIKHSS